MANDIYNYSVMTNTGKGFITHQDSQKFWIGGYPANVWVATDVRESRHWVARHNGISKTTDQAQALVTADVNAAKATWDADEREADVDRPTGKGSRPGDITIP